MAVIQSFFGPDIPNECSSCQEHTKCKNPFMTYGGEGKEKILIVGGWPSETEDKNNKFYSGTSGRELKIVLRLLGYNLEKDFWYTKGVSCFTDSKKPSKTTIKNCRKRVYSVIEKLKPKAILLFGNIGIESVIGEWVQLSSAVSLSELQIPLHDQNCWAFPLFAPEITLGNNRNKNMIGYFKYSLKKALDACLDLPELKPLNIIEKVKIYTEPELIIKELQYLLDHPEISAFDFEASGLDPYYPGHRIFSMAISTKNKSIAFPLEHPDSGFTDSELTDIWDLVYEYLEREDLPKIAHRTEFENKWCKILLKADVKSLVWCTKTTQHIVDNRTGTTGLKHQCFVKWGLKDFDKSAAPYIKAKNNSKFNTMHLMPLFEQLLYVGTDAWTTMLLYAEQKKELYSADTQVFFNDVTNMFSEMSINGIHIKEDFYEKEKIRLKQDIDNIYKDLQKSPEIKAFERKYSGAFNFKSNDDVRTLFFTELGCKSHAKTDNGKESVSKDALDKTNHWIAKELVIARKLSKIKDTYIAQFQREVRFGKIHPSFNVFIARSFRSSSQNPNLQNIPKRDKLAKWVTRKGLVPSIGNRLIEMDFSGAEVITSAAYNKDPNLINYLLDKNTDMHRDGGADIWCCHTDNISDMVRFFAKNNWTFPQFYGDYFGSCAKSLWDYRNEKLKDETTCLESLKLSNISTLKQFTEHCKRVEKIMWEERFGVYAQWRKDVQVDYREDDYKVYTYFDFVFMGYLDWKQVANYPIQGTAFHLLLKVLLKMRNWIKDNEMETLMIGQIHDSGLFDSPENEYKSVIKQFQKYTHILYDEYDWLEVRMEADAEVSLLDGNFAEMLKFDWDEPIEELEEKAKKEWKELSDKLFNE